LADQFHDTEAVLRVADQTIASRNRS
jgi:hypothetical protein